MRIIRHVSGARLCFALFLGVFFTFFPHAITAHVGVGTVCCFFLLKLNRRTKVSQDTSAQFSRARGVHDLHGFFGQI
ncbi:MAG: hypothetical protein WC803_05850 [Sphingomonas sp.]